MFTSKVIQLSKSKPLWTSKIPAIIGLFGLLTALWFMPTPEGLSPRAWHLFAIFLSTIVAIILNVLPMGATCIIALAVCGVTQTLTVKQALVSFSSPVIWLILLAFLLARGFIKTGLGSRIAYLFIQRMGKNVSGLAYGIITTEFLLAPFTPSNTARGGGIVYPIVQALAEEFESTPHMGTRRKIGSYLMKLAFQTNVITSAMFLTATAGNPVIVSLAEKFDVQLTWTTWALAALVPGIVNLAFLPWILQWIYPSELKETPNAPTFARERLIQMGKLSRSEWIMIGTFSLLLTLWIFGAWLSIDPTIAALVGLSVLLATRVLSWDDILKESNAWHTFIWLSILLTMSTYLTEFGLVEWCGEHLYGVVSSLHWGWAFTVIAFVYFYSHYGFASITAHISSMFSAFAMVAISAGTPAPLALLVLAFFSSLCAGITHYGTGTAPVYFGSEYITFKEWWRTGCIISIFNICVWSLLGGLWWKLLGLY